MTDDTGDEDGAFVALEARGHGPQNIVRVEDINILIDDDDIFQFGINAERNQGSLPLTTFVGWNGLLNCRIARNFPPPEEWA